MQLQHLIVSLALPIATSALSSSLGCFSKAPGLTDVQQYTFQSYGSCLRQCTEGNYEIAILKDGANCGCSHTAPDASDKVDKDQCDSVCPGYAADNCGGKNAYSILTTNFYTPENPDSASSSASLRTTDGGIVVAPTSASPTVPFAATTLTKATGTNTQGVMTNGITALPSTSKPVLGITALPGASSAAASASPSVKPNAADALRAGPIAGSLLAGLALLI